MQATRRQDFGEELSVSNLVGVQANRGIGIGLGFAETTERNVGASSLLVRGVVTWPLRESGRR